jgi:hypothetical protein
LIDPTAPVKKFTEDKEFLNLDSRNCGDNVENAAVFVRDGKHDGDLATHVVYRTFFQVKGVKFSNKTRVLAYKTLPLSHRQTGFSKQIGKEMWEAARKAGVNLPSLAESPFEDPDYSETPKGGGSFLKNAEKLIRVLKIPLPDD